MTIQYSTTLRNAQLDVIEATVGTSPKLRVYGGSVPANAGATASATLLAELTLPSDWLAAATGGTKGKAGTWSGAASASGTATHFRIYDSAGTTSHIQGTVGTSSADLIVDSTSFNDGQAFSVTTFTITTGEA